MLHRQRRRRLEGTYVSMLAGRSSRFRPWLAEIARRGAADGRPAECSAVQHLVKKEEAGDLAGIHGLRGLDAIHLATAIFVRKSAGPSPSPLRFLSSDQKLNSAAKKEKFRVFHF